jgi:hypothetical protein
MNSTVEGLASNGTNLYATGSFTTVNGGASNRGYGAAYQLSNGNLQSWNPNANSSIYGVAADNDTIYLGGVFTSLNSTTRNYVGAVKGTNGTANTGFNPSANTTAQEMYISGTQLAVCGSFTKINNKLRGGFAVYDLPPARLSDEEGAPETSVLNDSEIKFSVYPNPATDFVNVHFEQSLEPGTRVALMDMSGVKVFEIISNDPDNNLLQLETQNLKSGLYILYVETGNKVSTKKISIIR